MRGIWKWLQNSSLYRAQKFSQSTEVDLDIETQIQKKGDPPLIVNNLSMRFELGLKLYSVTCPHGLKGPCAKVDIDL